jgi:hypothetical protein
LLIKELCLVVATKIPFVPLKKGGVAKFEPPALNQNTYVRLRGYT